MEGETGLLWKWEASTSSVVSSCLESDTLKLGRQISHQNTVISSLWKVLGSPRAPVPGWPGKDVAINGEKSLTVWAGTVKRELCGYKKGRNPNRQSILKDGKESVGKENENGKVRLEKMETRKWTEMLRKADREEGENWSVSNVQYTPHEK